MLEFSSVSVILCLQTKQSIMKQANMAKCSRMLIVIFYSFSRKILFSIKYFIVENKL